MKDKKAKSEIVIDHPHHLAHAEALRRAKLLGDHLASKYRFKVNWDGDNADVNGSYMLAKVVGTVTLSDGRVTLKAADPGAALRQLAIMFVTDKLRLFFGPDGDKKIPK